MNLREASFTETTIAAADSPRHLLKKILDTTRECMLVIDADMRIAASNSAAFDAFGRGIDLEGRRLSEIVRDLDLHEAFRRAVFSHTQSEVRLELNTADRRRFDVYVAPLDLDGNAHAIGFFYETTKIERLESIRQEFLSNISHELRTPLTSILAFVETLEDGAIDDDENNRRFLGVIRRNAERMHSLIADILELSMIESGKVSVEPRRIALTELVDEIFASLGSKAQTREVELFNDIGRSVTVLADRVRIEQMLVNLIDNAIKFNRVGGSVTVTHECQSSVDLISVADAGEGIMPEQQTRIFERFYRVDRARSREMGGTGLGLAIVKHLAKLHGGEVTVKSILTEGSTFQIQLPRKD